MDASIVPVHLWLSLLLYAERERGREGERQREERKGESERDRGLLPCLSSIKTSCENRGVTKSSSTKIQTEGKREGGKKGRKEIWVDWGRPWQISEGGMPCPVNLVLFSQISGRDDLPTFHNL